MKKAVSNTRTHVPAEARNKKSAIAEGKRIYYNFVKPHQALDEKTPT